MTLNLEHPTIALDPGQVLSLDDAAGSRICARKGSVWVTFENGGKDALGWSMDGRWLVYYHPGDISDAWADGHSGVSPEIYNSCYQLGANVINYGHVEYAKWLMAKGQK